MLNPLIDDIFELILKKPVWQVHHLAEELKKEGKINSLDPDPSCDLFKRNFLIMNALYQLQTQLLPSQYLHIASLHIELLIANEHKLMPSSNTLKAYYLDWQHFETSKTQVEQLLNSFWQNFNKNGTKLGQPEKRITKEFRDQLLAHWQLSEHVTIKDIQKRWRQLALQYHPDKAAGNEEKFKQIKNEYEQLKASCSYY